MTVPLQTHVGWAACLPSAPAASVNTPFCCGDVGPIDGLPSTVLRTPIEGVACSIDDARATCSQEIVLHLTKGAASLLSAAS